MQASPPLSDAAPDSTHKLRDLAAAARPAAPEHLGLGTFRQMDGVVVDALELVKALHGTDCVELTGFAQEPALPAWTHPAIAQVMVADSPTEALESLAVHRRQARGMLAIAAVLLVGLAFAAGALTASRHLSSDLASPSLPVWSAVDVSDQGLVVATAMGRVTVPPGGKLPNGDVLLSVQPARRIAVLSSATLVLPPALRRSAP
ncbi:hypothetical protein [Ramlibacter sp. AN1133]|uniref:hypothetical protein n=1 Tax=Ramlibacter sp. AN1133 TaxID=3133429 RepID=UPI0030BC75FA